MKRFLRVSMVLLTFVSTAASVGGEGTTMPNLSITRDETGAVVLGVSAMAEPGEFRVERSPDLQQWEAVTSLQLDASESVDIVDPNHSARQQFYRLATDTPPTSAKADALEESSMTAPSETPVPHQGTAPGFPGSDPSSVRNDQQQQKQLMIEVTYHVVELTDDELDALYASGAFKEISREEALNRSQVIPSVPADRVVKKINYIRR